MSREEPHHLPFEVVRVSSVFLAIRIRCNSVGRLDCSLQVRNRYNSKFDSKFSAGYRDLALKVKLGFEVMRLLSSAVTAACSILPCRDFIA